MLQFEDVSKSFYFRGRMRPVIAHATFTAHFEENFGLVVPPRAGITTLVNLIMGAEQPDAGKIYRYGKISWPVGGVSGLIPALSGAENCRYIAMIYGLDPDDVLAFVIDLARIGRYMDMPVKTYSSTLQKRISLSLLLALEFDMYLVVEGATPGDPEFAGRAGPLLREKMSATPILFLGGSTEKMRDFCHQIAVIDDSRLHTFGAPEEAERFLAEEAVSYG